MQRPSRPRPSHPRKRPLWQLAPTFQLRWETAVVQPPLPAEGLLAAVPLGRLTAPKLEGEEEGEESLTAAYPRFRRFEGPLVGLLPLLLLLESQHTPLSRGPRSQPQLPTTT
jgi:hypothetical protein